MLAPTSSDHAKSTVARKSAPAGAAGRKPPQKNSIWQSIAMRRDSIQPKLNVSQPGDVDEQKADNVADRVMNAPASGLQRSACACGGGGCSTCQNDPGKHDTTVGSPATASILNPSSSSTGRPIEAGTRDLMESRFGHDFSDVRVHADDQAAEAARSIEARAFTTGRDIVFGAGEYQPSTSQGQRLIAHELAHVTQQQASGTAIQRTPGGPPAPSWTASDLTQMLDKCDGGLGIRAKARAANDNKDPTIVPGDGGQVDLNAGVITLDRTQDKCFAVQQLIQELSNLSRKASFQSLSRSARSGDVSREDFIKRFELIEYETGVKNVLTAFDACKDQWPCTSTPKEWARSAKDFQDYYDNFLSSEHKENYGQWWDKNCKMQYEKKSGKKGPGGPTGASATPDAMHHVAGGLWATNEKGKVLMPSLEDIDQGGLADCYLMAALGAIVNTQPEKIFNMIADHGDDSYTVTFKGIGFFTSSEQKVTADFPVGKHADVGKRKAIWPLVIEKAYAQEKGGYDKIGQGGYPGTVVDDLLNVSASTFNPQEETADYIMGKVVKAKKEKWPMTIYSPKKEKASAEKKQVIDSTPGLYYWHAYTIIDVDAKGNRIKLFNPWGRDHPNGDGWISVETVRKVFTGLQING